MSGRSIAVLIVDDSAVVRQVLTAQLGADPEIEVLGAAADPIFAMDKMSHRWPDVIVLDLEMPRMDGISFLRHIMATHPTPVVICSTMTQRGAETKVLLVQRLQEMLRPGGHLIIGHAETLNGIPSRLQLVEPSIHRMPGRDDV